MLRPLLLVMVCGSSFAFADLPTVRVAVLQFGTLNWEMDVIRHHGLDKKYQFQLDVTPVGGKNASSVALQSEAVDLIYSDWVWVNRQRHNKRMYGFSPVSAVAGGVYVQPDLNVTDLSDLEGIGLGIAGGAVDKSWLLLQAYTKKTFSLDLAGAVKPVYAAPPLLNKLMYDGKLQASLNFWHYSARLKAKGFVPLITVHELLKNLGLSSQIPLLGWVFSEQWAVKHPDVLNRFLLASAEARQIMLESDDEWLRLNPLTKSESDAVLTALRDEYRKGVLKVFNRESLKALNRLYQIFAREGGKKLTGGASQLDLTMFLMPSASGIRMVISESDDETS